MDSEVQKMLEMGVIEISYHEEDETIIRWVISYDFEFKTIQRKC
jgi:hypothetical protein